MLKLKLNLLVLGSHTRLHWAWIWFSKWKMFGFGLLVFCFFFKGNSFCNSLSCLDFSSLPEEGPMLINSQIPCSEEKKKKKALKDLALVYTFWLSLLGSCIPKCVNHVITVKLWVIQCYLPLILAGSLICYCNYVSVSTSEIKSTEIPSNRTTTILVGWNSEHLDRRKRYWVHSVTRDQRGN